MTFEEWKSEYLKYRATHRIEVGWDADHAYHMSGDGCPSPDDCDSPDDAYDFESEDYNENGPTLYCVPHIPSIEGLRGGCDCFDTCCNTDEEMVDWLEGFLAQVKLECKEKWYRTDELAAYIDQLKAKMRLTEILST